MMLRVTVLHECPAKGYKSACINLTTRPLIKVDELETVTFMILYIDA